MRSPFLALVVLASGAFLTACGGAKAPTPPTTPNPSYAAANSGPVLYRLPVVGSWRVQRTHYGAQNDQAYALDLVINIPVSMRGVTKNEEYPSYNQPIVADAPGYVVIAVDGIPDSALGAPNVYDMHGNFVVIDHQNGEFSLFAHFIPGSLKVRPGMFVAAGTELGRCGNSGHSTMPHLHWQVMSSATATGARGIAPRYAPYERNGTMSSDLPQSGDLVQAR